MIRPRPATAPHRAADGAPRARANGARRSGRRRLAALAAALLVVIVATGAAAAGDAADSAQLDSVVVTGTRSAGVQARDSVTPVDVVHGDDLVATGQTTLLDALRQVLPQLSTPAVGYDLGALARTFQLRGLSPDHTLVLVNGKRRHLSASLYADSDPAQGSNAVDLDLIPLAAVERVEVLRDGAAAQYGSDAIAGVINVILRQDAKGGSASLLGGGYLDGGGGTGELDLSQGLALDQGGSLRLSAGWRDHEDSNRSGSSGGVQPARLQGDPQVQLGTLGFDLERPLGEGLSAYAFGTLAHRSAKAYENPRQPGTLGAAVDALYPQGFSPRETLVETDASVAGGLRGVTAGGWQWDAALAWGGDHAAYGDIDTINPDLLAVTGNAQQAFSVGGFRSSEADATLDLRRPLELASATSAATLAAGAELRRETFGIDAGEPASYYLGGSQAFPGFQPSDRSDDARLGVASYVELDSHPSAGWEVDGALRAEHYQDVGGSLAGKLSTRWQLDPALALRAALSNGFHAPTLAQQHYSATVVTNGYAQVQLPLGSPGARLLGAPDLRPETSRNLSLGLVGTPAPSLDFSLDAYAITIDDRIIQSASIFGPQVAAAVAANGAVIPAGVPANGVTAAFFTNGVDTLTRGLDFHLGVRGEPGDRGWVKWTLDANLNRSSIRRVHPAPAVLQTAGLALVDVVQASNLTTASPHLRAALGVHWFLDNSELAVTASYYGPTTQVQGYAPGPYYSYGNGAAWIFDGRFGVELAPTWHADLGAANLFNHYPARMPPAVYQALNYDQYSHVSPYGINGAFCYARLTRSF